MPTSNETRVRVEGFWKIIPRVRPGKRWCSSCARRRRFSSSASWRTSMSSSRLQSATLVNERPFRLSATATTLGCYCAASKATCLLRAPKDVGCSAVKACRLTRGGEGRSDLLHLADPTPAFGRSRARGPPSCVREARQRQRPFILERIVDAGRACDVSDREQQRRCPLRPGGVDHLQR